MSGRFGRTLSASVALALCLSLGATLVASAGSGDDDTSFGAGIYQGSCDIPGDRADFDIGDLEADDDDDAATPKIGGTPVAGPVYAEDEGLSASLDDLTSNPYVVVIRQSEAADAPIVACGAITGEQTNDELRVTLDPIDDSGVSGLATFGPADARNDDGDQTEVDVEVQTSGTHSASTRSPAS